MKVASSSMPITPPSCPISNHAGSDPVDVRSSLVPFGICTSGTWSRLVTNGAVSPVVWSTPMPTRTEPASVSTTADTTIVGSACANSGIHRTSPTLRPAGGPRASSTKSSSAVRWSGSDSMCFRPCGLLGPPAGSPNQAEFVPVAVVSPKARERLPNVPRSSSAMVIADAPAR